MRGKLIFITGVAVGYVLGTRAGRKRYEQMKSAALKVWESPGIQRQVGQLEDYAAEKIGDIPGALYVGIKKVVQGRSKGDRRPASLGQSPHNGESNGPVDTGSAVPSSE
jgi:hypothetical protein